jgi:hypothetical protein
MCERAANQRVWRLAEQAVKYSDAVGTIEIAPVHKALGRILVQRFVTERRDIDEQQAERALSSAVSQRGAAMRYDPADTKTFEELESELAEAYVMRSRLAHGSLSPFDPEVAAFAPACLHRIEQVICWGLGLFESHGLFDRELTNRQLAEGFDGLILFAQKRNAAPGYSSL